MTSEIAKPSCGTYFTHALAGLVVGSICYSVFAGFLLSKTTRPADVPVSMAWAMYGGAIFVLFALLGVVWGARRPVPLLSKPLMIVGLFCVLVLSLFVNVTLIFMTVMNGYPN